VTWDFATVKSSYKINATCLFISRDFPVFLLDIPFRWIFIRRLNLFLWQEFVTLCAWQSKDLRMCGSRVCLDKFHKRKESGLTSSLLTLQFFLFYFPLNLSTLTRFRVKGHNSRCLIYKGFYNYSALLIYSVIVNNNTKLLDISRSFGKESNPY